MSEEAHDPVTGETAPPEQVRTGVTSVDDVIAAVEQLEERPLEEHVGVFETAHEQLRRALDSGQLEQTQQSEQSEQPDRSGQPGHPA